MNGNPFSSKENLMLLMNGFVILVMLVPGHLKKIVLSTQ